MKINFINNFIANKNKGIYLFISLILILILFGLCVVLIKISLTQKNIFFSSSKTVKLSNNSNNANRIIDYKINKILLEDLKNTPRSNIIFIDTSNPTEIVKYPVTIDNNIYKQIYLTDPTTKTMSLIDAPDLKGTFSIITSKVYTSSKLSTVNYDLKIRSTICNTVNGNKICGTEDLFTTKNISCPPPTNRQGTMKALLKKEFPNIIPIDKFPIIYCTCSDPTYSKTKSDGSCETNSPTCPTGYTLYGTICCPPNSNPSGTGHDIGNGCKCNNSRLHGDLRFTIGSQIYSACDLTCGGNLGLFGGSDIVIQNRVDVLAGSPGKWGYCSYSNSTSSCAASCRAWGYSNGQAYADNQSCVCSR